MIRHHVRRRGPDPSGPHLRVAACPDYFVGDPADGRATLLWASRAARDRTEQVARHRRRQLDDRLGDWGDEDLAAFVAILERYNASLD